jgi:hypothetical protein
MTEDLKKLLFQVQNKIPTHLEKYLDLKNYRTPIEIDMI